MKKNEIALRPTYWASVSGGKDSLLMLYIILNNPKKYPLDGVVHFELEIDFPFVKKVIDYMQSECEKLGIRFIRIKPKKTWEELYEKYGFPTRKFRWCNSKYKLNAKKQLEEFIKKQGYYTVYYIGYCKDEEKRYAKRIDLQKIERYPLVEEGIEEKEILEWAKKQPIFNHYYETQKRCGCMFCPIAKLICHAYTFKYYKKDFEYMIEKMKETEKVRKKELKRDFSCISSKPKYNAEYLENIIKNKWIKKLEEVENKKQK